MSDRSNHTLKGAEALLEWCRRQTRGYPDVKIRDMNSSWKNGLAFCAIIHHFRPELIDFGSLSKYEAAKNNELAFALAEKELGIPRLLEVCDMVEMDVPDDLSVITYVSLYYQHFKDKQTASMAKVKYRRGLYLSSSNDGSCKGKPKRYLIDVLCDEN